MRLRGLPTVCSFICHGGGGGGAVRERIRQGFRGGKEKLEEEEQVWDGVSIDLPDDDTWRRNGQLG